MYSSSAAEKLSGSAGTLISVEEAFLFNSVQRAHQNHLENFPFVAALLLVTWTSYPIIAGFCGLSWVIGRQIYFEAYSRGGPGKRMGGGVAPVFIYPALFALLGLCFATGVQLFRGIAPY